MLFPINTAFCFIGIESNRIVFVPLIINYFSMLRNYIEKILSFQTNSIHPNRFSDTKMTSVLKMK
jgi:hypothetical protein